MSEINTFTEQGNITHTLKTRLERKMSRFLGLTTIHGWKQKRDGSTEETAMSGKSGRAAARQ